MGIKEKLIKIKDLIISKKTDYHEFEPLLTEIEDSPINPLGNIIFWTIILFILTAGLWMYFGKVDIVISARGMIIPSGEEKIIRSLDKGVVTSIPVTEGQFVKQGDVVAVVSPAEYEPALELNNLREEEVRLSEKLAADNVKYRIARDKRSRLESVTDIIPKARYDEVLSECTELSHEIGSIKASLGEVRNKRIQLEKRRQIIKSPIDGYINRILIHTQDEVVTPAQALLTIVPKDAEFMIKAKVLNMDAGFIESGMPVTIKVDTYNFQKYGTLCGTVTVVSPNSTEDERLGSVYEVYIKPNNTTLTVEGKEQQIRFGMTTMNEIKIGKRRVIEFFIYPLIKYLDESIKVSYSPFFPQRKTILSSRSIPRLLCHFVPRKDGKYSQRRLGVTKQS